MDAEFAVGKAHEVVSIDELKPLTSKPSNELMSSHIHKLCRYANIFFCCSFLWFSVVLNPGLYTSVGS